MSHVMSPRSCKMRFNFWQCKFHHILQMQGGIACEMWCYHAFAECNATLSIVRPHTQQSKCGLNNEYSECHNHNNERKEEDISESWVEEKELLLRVCRLQTTQKNPLRGYWVCIFRIFQLQTHPEPTQTRNQQTSTWIHRCIIAMLSLGFPHPLRSSHSLYQEHQYVSHSFKFSLHLYAKFLLCIIEWSHLSASTKSLP